MAEILVGDVLARLRGESTQFTQTLAQAIQQLGQLNQAAAQARTQQAQNQQSTQQSAHAYAAVTQALARLIPANQQLIQTFRQAQQSTAASTQALTQLTQQLQTLQATQRQTAQSTQTLGSTFQTALSVAGGIGLATSLAGIVAAVKNMVTESVRLAARMQDLNLSFRSMEGSSSGASRTLTSLFDTAQRLGVEFTTLVEGFRRLNQAAQGTGLQGEQIRQVFESVVAGARIMGISQEELKRTIVTLGQVLTKGRLEAEEYRGQLAEAVPGALRILAGGIGVTTRQFEEMVELGIIPADLAIAAFGKGMQDLVGATAPVARLSETFNQLKNETTAWMTAIGEGIGSTLQPFLDTLVNLSKELRTLFSIRAPGTGPAPPGASTGSFLYPFVPRTTGFLPGSPYMPSEFEGQAGGLPFASSKYDDLIRQQAARIALDPALFSRLVRQESAFNPRAVSPAGAAGLGQLMPETGREFGLQTLQDFYDPEKNLTAAANVLQQYRKIIQDKFGTLAAETEILLAAYNAGIGNVIKAITETQATGEQVTFAQVLGRLPKPQETGPYVAAITGARQQAPVATAATIDPYRNVSKSIDETRASLDLIQKTMANLQKDGLNFAGNLEGGLNKQAQQAVDKFSKLALFFAAFPEQFAKLTPVQKEQLQLLAQQVATIEAARGAEAATGAEAAKRVQVMRQFEEQLAREQAQDQQQYQEAIDKVTMSLATQEEQALKTLAAINAQFFQRREERALDTVADIQKQFPGNEAIQAQAAQAEASLKARDAYNLEVEALKERFVALKQNADAMREQEATTEKFTQDVGERLAALQTPRDERLSAQFRRRAEREDVDLTPQLQAQLRLIDEQMRWNTLMDHAGRIGDQAAQTITSGLMRMTEGTVAVGEGFRAMAKDIADSLTQIALNETFKTLFGLGLGLLSGAATGGTAGFGGNTGYGLLAPVRAAEGLGPINRPTLALIGEGSNNPEVVLNKPQISSLVQSAMRAGPSAGGQGASGISIINVASREQAEATAAQERAMGRQVVVNYVLEELGQGSGSRISQVMRSTLR